VGGLRQTAVWLEDVDRIPDAWARVRTQPVLRVARVGAVSAARQLTGDALRWSSVTEAGPAFTSTGWFHSIGRLSTLPSPNTQ
jgi:hypothetical protein